MNSKLKVRLFLIAIDAIREANRQTVFVSKSQAWRQYNEAKQILRVEDVKIKA